MARFVLFRHGESAPTMLQCIECDSKIKKKEVILGRARGIGEHTCVCAACLPGVEEREKPAKETDLPTVGDDDDFVSYLHVAKSDTTIRKTVLAISHLNTEERNRVLNNLIVSMGAQNAPAELLSFFETLRDEAVARRVRELLSC